MVGGDEWSVDLKRREGGQNEKASRGHTDTVLPPFVKTYNYGLCAKKNSSRLIRFTVNSIYIYGSKLIYYENIFYN
jgi:hypothetical protein